jgi:hypothetical protein
MVYPGANMVFDDNFEFPIYTTANQPFSMSGAASSTYSLYEDSGNYNRSSFAASDSDICGNSVTYQTQQKMLTDLNHQQQLQQQQQQQQLASIYSTNFNNKSSQQLQSQNNGFASTGLASASSNSSDSTDMMSASAQGGQQSYIPDRVKSESNLMCNGGGHTYDHLIETNGNTNGLDIQQHYQLQQQQQQQQQQQRVMNAYEMNTSQSQEKPNFYNSNEIDLQRSLMSQNNVEYGNSNQNQQQQDNNVSSISLYFKEKTNIY